METGNKICLQGHDIIGWDTADMESMDDIRGYLSQLHYGRITAYLLGEGRKVLKSWDVPAGLCNLRPMECRESDYSDYYEEDD